MEFVRHCLLQPSLEAHDVMLTGVHDVMLTGVGHKHMMS